MSEAKDYKNGRCCVFQPFDNGGDFDKRFEDTLAPAIEEAQMEPYRVDRDLDAVIPIDALHSEIRSSVICVADITTRNPNVMYELGYAIAAEKDVVILSGPSDKFPFDIQHRGILPYSVGSKSDFEALGKKLTGKLLATIARQERTQTVQTVVASSPMKSYDGLLPHETTLLALLLANTEATGDPVRASLLKQEMRKALYNEIGTRMALARLKKLGFIDLSWEDGWNNEKFAMYGLTDVGEAWLVDNQSDMELTIKPQPDYSKVDYGDAGITDDDIPF